MPSTHTTQDVRAATKAHAIHTMCVCVCEAEEWAVDGHSDLVVGVVVCGGGGGWRRGMAWWLVVAKAQKGVSVDGG